MGQVQVQDAPFPIQMSMIGKVIGLWKAPLGRVPLQLNVWWQCIEMKPNSRQRCIQTELLSCSSESSMLTTCWEFAYSCTNYPTFPEARLWPTSQQSSSTVHRAPERQLNQSFWDTSYFIFNRNQSIFWKQQGAARRSTSDPSCFPSGTEAH